jgi:hypothetical protein
VVPPAPAEAGKLAGRYASPALGTLTVRKQDGATIFDFGTWYSAVASRKNDDGTISFVTIDPTVDGFTSSSASATASGRWSSATASTSTR